MQNILVTGANGQLGLEFQDLAKNYSDYNFIFVNTETTSFEPWVWIVGDAV